MPSKELDRIFVHQGNAEGVMPNSALRVVGRTTKVKSVNHSRYTIG